MCAIVRTSTSTMKQCSLRMIFPCWTFQLEFYALLVVTVLMISLRTHYDISSTANKSEKKTATIPKRNCANRNGEHMRLTL